MLTPGEILFEGEKLIGDYNAQIARWHDGFWTPTMPIIYVILSDHRMILQPHGRKRHEPAVIPRRFVSKILDLQMGYRHGIVMYLKTDQHIAMYMADDPEKKLIRYLQDQFVPPKPIELKSEIDQENIRKLIEFFDSF